MNLITESANSQYQDIDVLSTRNIVKLINDQNKMITEAIEEKDEIIANVIDKIAVRFKKGGRLIYIGAGSSGRIGVLDAVELMPTYGISHEKAFGIIAGGDKAMFMAVEGAEDSESDAINDLEKLELNERDSLIAIAASGNTPYTVAALKYANLKHTLTVSITNNENTLMEQNSDYTISVIVGAEVISGSTRMKAGTSQKMVLNTISTVLMIKIGKVYKNYMVNVQATNDKLIRRSINMIQQITGLEEKDAIALFEKSDHNVAKAIVMQKTGCNAVKAEKVLQICNDDVRKSITYLEK